MGGSLLASRFGRSNRRAGQPVGDGIVWMDVTDRATVWVATNPL